MGWLSRLLGIELGRNRGFGSSAGEMDENRRLKRPPPTPSTRTPKAPPPTPSTQRLRGVGQTAGTRTYGTPHGTPSTQRIHNPPHPGA